MLALLKILHFLALAVGLGGGIANAIVGARTAQARQVGGPIQAALGRASLGALIVLWITGVWMAVAAHDLSSLGVWFWVKMAAVLALTAGAVAARVEMRRPGPDTPRRMKLLGMAMTGSSTLAVVFAVLAFA